jgi:hypothetical protein
MYAFYQPTRSQLPEKMFEKMFGQQGQGNTNSWGTNSRTLSTLTGNGQLERRYLSFGGIEMGEETRKATICK